ncbi:hypothetical protein F441_09449 [Phytophthora nicotianae CJ01A1]|uniref:Uncharacterized protein n=3 Tax=Phytophthora nicotianae TaxID=4792 RepID=W2LBH2_PHYNI|nr:hypothetical protein L915_09311 [Phytophthora nicotianae]ETL41568.1 hypothetical protein L916_07495 [Phytophthora nicotianae]ETL94732.1 hypothetical protein L917_07373 [Phytophthora nicotianae]ETO74777.1 hypothetical protein F444_09575 [Phytophthora nicotianae P1976]ETP15911.1 hypothetical protein F441_09449 [Phytophthora nicotianae CJ01A1]
MYRNRLNNIRNPGIYWIHVFMYTYLGFMVFLVFISVPLLPFFIEQRAVFAREWTTSSLSVVSYVCSKFLDTLPGTFLATAMSTAVVTLLTDLNAIEHFLLNMFLPLVVSKT